MPPRSPSASFYPALCHTPFSSSPLSSSLPPRCIALAPSLFSLSLSLSLLSFHAPSSSCSLIPFLVAWRAHSFSTFPSLSLDRHLLPLRSEHFRSLCLFVQRSRSASLSRRSRERRGRLAARGRLALEPRLLCPSARRSRRAPARRRSCSARSALVEIGCACARDAVEREGVSRRRKDEGERGVGWGSSTARMAKGRTASASAAAGRTSVLSTARGDERRESRTHRSRSLGPDKPARFGQSCCSMPLAVHLPSPSPSLTR